MATVKGILVNDGGAPARIINFIAGEDISAGEALKMHTTGKAMLATNGALPIMGLALTDAADGAQVSCITGSGVVCYAITLGVAVGDGLNVGGTAGALETSTDEAVALCLETNTTSGSLTKVLVTAQEYMKYGNSKFRYCIFTTFKRS